MLGFDLDFWDYATFVTFALASVAVVTIALFIAGLPGRIAIARKHPDAEAVKIMGYAGFLPVVPWIQAFIWAFKPTDIVDVRRFPKDEARAIDEDIARLEDDSKSMRDKVGTGTQRGDVRHKAPAPAEPASPAHERGRKA